MPTTNYYAAGGGIQNSQLYRMWTNRIKGESANDLLILVTPHSSTSGSGSGKTTLGLQFAKTFDDSESGFVAERNATMDAREIPDTVLPESEDRSAILWDEAQGTPTTPGLDSRRGMTDASIDAINAVLASRDQRHTLIVVAQAMKMLDPRLYPMVDAWVCILHDPSQPGGPLAGHYKFIVDDFEVSDPDYKTVGIEEFGWADLPDDDPAYQAMEAVKQRVKTSNDDEDDPEEVERKEKISAAIRGVKPWRDDKGMTQTRAAEVIGMSQTWVNRRMQEFEEGEYRSLVEVPEAYRVTAASDDETEDSANAAD